MDPRLASASVALAGGAALDVPWYRTVTREQWRVLLAAKFGWMLDAMDFMLYTMAIGQLRMYFGFGDDTAGMLGTVTLVMSGVGGTIFGYVADRFGRTRALMATILIFSLASLGAATSQTVMQLLFWRAVLGIGMGGEWASGAVLVSETWPAHLRNKAISIMQSGWALGYMMAVDCRGDHSRIAVPRRRRLAVAVRGRRGAGVLHAVDSALRQGTGDLEAEGAGRRTDRAPSRSSSGRCSSGARSSSSRWAPRSSSPTGACSSGCRPFWPARWTQGGAGMGIVGSLPWIIPVQLGAYFGYLTFGFIADRIGRRQAFVLYMVSAAMLVPIYGQMARSPVVLLLLGPLIGYFGYGYFSMFGSFVAEFLPDGGARHRTGHQLQHRADGRGRRAVYDWRACDAARRRDRPRPQRDIGLLPAGGRVDLHAPQPERPGARSVNGETMTQARFGAHAVTTPPGTISLQTWVPCIGMALCSWLSFVDRQVLAILTPTIMADTGLTPQHFTDAASFFFLAYTLGNPVWGSAIDFLGLRFGMLLAVAVWTGASMSHAMMSSFLGFAVARAVLGLGEGATFPGGLRTAVETLPAHLRARGIALSFSGGTIGAVMMPLLLGPLAIKYGWRAAFLTTGALGAIWLIIWAVDRQAAVPPRLAAQAVEDDVPESSASAACGRWCSATRCRRSRQDQC